MSTGIPFDRFSREDFDLIEKIASRAIGLVAITSKPPKKMTLVMDLAACHLVAAPLKLSEMLHAPMSDFAHDVFGITRHINRETGQLEDCFLPRFARIGTEVEG